MVEAGGGGSGSRDLDKTPTWAVAMITSVIVLVSFFLEKIIRRIGQWFRAKHKTALFDALEKIKSELMVLGFISLLLTIVQNYITKICIPVGMANSMLPCNLVKDNEEQNRRKLSWNSNGDSARTRSFLVESLISSCPIGKVSFVSINGLHQLHIFIFFLAIFHVVFSALTMTLGRMKIRRWKEWEVETQTQAYELSYDPSRIRLVHETSFVKQHTSLWNRHPALLYFVCFFHQFFTSVQKSDYLTLRHGFINAHLAKGSRFNFQKYIKRSLEDDFKVVVEISPHLWATSVIFLLLNIHGWKELFWLSIIPPIILLAIGTDLHAIMSKMAIELTDRHLVIQGIPLVQLSDKHFWFERPDLVLSLMHFTLFMNAFQLTYFFWIWYDFGLRSCFHENIGFIIPRVLLGVIVQIMCCYITLPLHALISQMGSHMKRSIFDEQTNQGLKKWHKAARKLNKKQSSSPSPAISSSTTPMSSPSSSPVHLLHRYIDIGYSDLKQKRCYTDQENEKPLSTYDAKPFANKDSLDTSIDYFSKLDNRMKSSEFGAVESQAAELCMLVKEETTVGEIITVKPKEKSDIIP